MIALRTHTAQQAGSGHAFRRRLHVATLATAGALVLASCGGSSNPKADASDASAATAAADSSGPIKVSVSANSHKEYADHVLDLNVSATQSGKPARGKAYYQFLFHGHAVHTSPLQTLANGRTTFALKSSKLQAIEGGGHTFIARVTVKNDGGSGSGSWPIEIQR
jgi:hypothetical protein